MLNNENVWLNYGIEDNMKIHNLGYPRIGSNQEYFNAYKKYWAGLIPQSGLIEEAYKVRHQNWLIQKKAGIHVIPCNDFAYFDSILETCLLFGAIPERYQNLEFETTFPDLDLGLAMAKGWFENGDFIEPMKRSQWFNTKYQYIVPEFNEHQIFHLRPWKILKEFRETKLAGISSKPVLMGPISFLLLGQGVNSSFNRLDLIGKLLPKYIELIQQLDNLGLEYLQLDEPCFAYNLSKSTKKIITKVYDEIQKKFPKLTVIVATYFSVNKDNLPTLLTLSAKVIHLDLVNNPELLYSFTSGDFLKTSKIISLGIVNGANVWKNNLELSITQIKHAINKLGIQRVWLAPSCSLIHIPCDLDHEDDKSGLTYEMKKWFSFAKQKLGELNLLFSIIERNDILYTTIQIIDNNKLLEDKHQSSLINIPEVKDKIIKHVGSSTLYDSISPFENLLKRQNTINGREKKCFIINDCGTEAIDHTYLYNKLSGFVCTSNGWVQVSGDSCFRPYIIFGDIQLRKLSKVEEKSLFDLIVTRKNIQLNGPNTTLSACFIRDDQPSMVTGFQLALANRQIMEKILNYKKREIEIFEPLCWQLISLNIDEIPKEIRFMLNLILFTIPTNFEGSRIELKTANIEFKLLKKFFNDYPVEWIEKKHIPYLSENLWLIQKQLLNGVKRNKKKIE